MLITTAGGEAEDNWFGQRLLNAFGQDLQTPAYKCRTQMFRHHHDAFHRRRSIRHHLQAETGKSAARPTAFFKVRNEFYNDIVESRTGHATAYSEDSVGVTWWPNKIIRLRPELRFDHSYDTATFDNGTRRNQFSASMDFIIHY